MRVRALVTAGLALVASGAFTAGAEGERAGRTTIGAQNGGSEFSLVLSRTNVKPGPAFIEYVNTGEDPHNLLLKKVGGKRMHGTDDVLPGDRDSFELRLRARSRYRLWCSFEGHREDGMKARVKVRRRR